MWPWESETSENVPALAFWLCFGSPRSHFCAGARQNFVPKRFFIHSPLDNDDGASQRDHWHGIHSRSRSYWRDTALQLADSGWHRRAYAGTLVECQHGRDFGNASPSRWHSCVYCSGARLEWPGKSRVRNFQDDDSRRRRSALYFDDEPSSGGRSVRLTVLRWRHSAALRLTIIGRFPPARFRLAYRSIRRRERFQGRRQPPVRFRLRFR